MTKLEEIRYVISAWDNLGEDLTAKDIVDKIRDIVNTPELDATLALQECPKCGGTTYSQHRYRDRDQMRQKDTWPSRRTCAVCGNIWWGT